MNYKQLLKDTWEIAKNYKVVWLLGALPPVPLYILSLTISNGNLAIACFIIILSIIFMLLAAYREVGLIQVVNKAMSGEKSSMREIWITLKTRWGQLIVLTVFLLFLIFPFLCLLSVVSLSQLPSLKYLAAIIYSIFSTIVSPFAIRGVIIGKLKAYESINRGLLISLKNLKPVLCVGLSFWFVHWFIQRVLFTLAGLIIMSGQGDGLLSSMFPFNQPILLEIPVKAVNDILDYATSLLTYPLQSIMFTIMYIKFTAVEPPAEQELGEVIS